MCTLSMVFVVLILFINQDGVGARVFGTATNVGAGLPPLPASANPPAGAIVGKSLSMFNWVDVKVVGKGGSEVPNIVEVAPGVFKCFIRIGQGWHDGNLKPGRQDYKGRAEMHSLGGDSPFKLGETWLIGATTLFPADYSIKDGFCQISQTPKHVGYFNMNKTTSSTVSGGAYVFTRGLGSPSKLVRPVSVPKGKWFSWCFKIKFAQNGYYAMSINGDAFRGVDLDLTIGHVRFNTIGKVLAHGNTWGLYLIASGSPREVAVYHANVFIKKVS